MTHTIIRSVRLYNDNNGSDKVINMYLVDTGNGFLLNYENGPNGGTMVPRTKTPQPVSKHVAEKEWDKLFKQKVKPNEYRVDDINASHDNYTPPTSTKQSSGSDTMMLSEVKNDAHREALLDSPNHVVQEKFNGRFLKVIVKSGAAMGSNKKGILIELPTKIREEILSHGVDLEIDSEHISDHIYVFEMPSHNGISAGMRYHDRYARLHSLGLNSAFIHVVTSSDTTRQSKLNKINEIKARGGEGVVFKDLTAPYEPGISQNFIKDKFTESVTVCVLKHNEGINSVVIGAYDANGEMIEMNSVSTPVKPPVGSIIEVEYLYANPNTNALQQPVYKGLRSDQDLSDCLISKLKFETPLDHGLFSVANSIKQEQYIHGNWTHIFHENGGDVPLRFVFDTSSKSIVNMDIQRSLGWQSASASEIENVLDSLLNANDEALKHPEEWGLEVSDSLPNWAAKKTTPRPRI